MSKRVIAMSCDIECSNLYDKLGGDLLSMAFVEILEDFTLGRSICEYSRATNPIYFNEESARVHGFSYWKAMKFQKRIDSIMNVINWLKEIKSQLPLKFLYYGNAKFDWKWLESHFYKEDLHNNLYKAFPESMIESVLKMARENLVHIKESNKTNPITGKKYGKFSLRNVADHYGIELDHHEALSDAMANAQIYCNIQKGKDTWTGKLF